MKDLRGQASGSVPAPVEQCYELLAAVERYPSWYPETVREAAVLERDGNGDPVRASAQLHVAYGPLVRDFHLTLAVQAERPRAVRLSRIPHEPTDEERFEVRWRLIEGGRTRIELELEASLSVPRFLPVGGIGDSIAEGFVGAAVKALA